MGVRVNTYVFVGADIGYDTQQKLHKDKDIYDVFEKYIDDGWDKKIKSHNGITGVFDGMSGEYFFMGRALARTGIDEDFFEERWEINPQELRKIITEVRLALRKEFKKNYKVKLHVFTHHH